MANCLVPKVMDMELALVLFISLESSNIEGALMDDCACFLCESGS